MPNLGAFKHGVSWADVPTSVISPVPAYPGLNVVFGSAPLHLVADGNTRINKPNIFNSYEDAVTKLGYSSDWQRYDICEHMDALFVEFGMFPVVYVPVNDPEDGAVDFPETTFTLVQGQVDLGVELIRWLIVIQRPEGMGGVSGNPTPPKSGDNTPPPKKDVVTYVEGEDYLLSLSDQNTWIVTKIPGGRLSGNQDIVVSGKIVTETDIEPETIIGGVDVDTGARSGLEVIEDVFQTTGFVPGVIICPKFSHNALVAAAMEAKSESINGCFACTCLIDVDTAACATFQDVHAWKQSQNIVFPRQQCLFGKPALLNIPGVVAAGDKIYNFASQQGPLMQWTDTYKGLGLPFNSPSNKPLRMNALLRDDGSPLSMNLLDANMLNGMGVVTALNFIGGWRSWGNRTAAFPSTTDVKDMFIPVRRMFDFVGNTIVLTIWQEVDEPGNRRLIDAVVNSLQLWLDGLTNQQGLIGARIEFRQDENPTTEILNGHYVFHVYIAVPTPGEWLDFRVEYWVPFIANLWPDAAAAA